MDILISSNLERLIYWAAGNDAKKNVEFMTALTKEGVYEITPQMQEKLKDFYGNYASEEETAEAIRTLYEKTGYILDTHTAVAQVYMENIKQRQRMTRPQLSLHLQQVRSNSAEALWMRSIQNTIQWKSLN